MRQAIFTSGEPLTDEQIFRVSPSVFAETPHESRSERYSFIPTISVVNGLRKEGFFPFSVAQSISRIEGKTPFTKHLLKFRQAKDMAAVGTEINEIVLVNSHDGTSSYRMMAGIFRIACLNGLIRGDIASDINVRHNGNNPVNDVIEAAYSITEEFPVINEKIETMKQIELTCPEQEAFAEAALSLKYDEGKAPVNEKKILQTNRYEDNKNDLWTKFNTVQENLIKGGQRAYTADYKRVTTRPVNSIDGNVRLNKALWILAEKMIELKNSSMAA
ncbi:MAG: DUF932 domain-containing protein [bacterium]|jgi:hypothetical protein